MNLLEKNYANKIYMFHNQLEYLIFSDQLWQTMWYHHPVLAVHAFFPIPSFWFPFHHCSLQMVPQGHYFFYLLLATLRSEFLKTLFPWLMQFLSRSLLELDLSFFTFNITLFECNSEIPCKRIVVGWFTVTILRWAERLNQNKVLMIGTPKK